MRVIIGIVASILSILCLFLLFLPWTLTIFVVITAGSFIAFHLSQNPAGVSRALAHVRSLSSSAPKFWLPPQEAETPCLPNSRTDTTPSLSPIRPKLTDSIKERGKENIINYVRPTLKARRFRNTVERSEIQGQSPQQNWFPLKNSTGANFSTWSPRVTGDGVNFSAGFTFDEKTSFSKLPLSPIYPPNKSVDSPELDVSSPAMLRFNSGQDSLLHPSMHYPTHQPDLVTSPGLVPSVSWLKNGSGGLSSPRYRRGLPQVQSPVMVKIARPLPDRPASPLFRKLATESDTQKSSSAEKVIMAIKQRQKRTAGEADQETNSALTPAGVRNESKRRKLDSTSDLARGDADMDLDPIPRRMPGRKTTVFRPTRFGITTATSRNPIVSSFSSSKKAQTTLKRRKDTSSVEVEEEDSVSPIKKTVPPPTPYQSQTPLSPSRMTQPPTTGTTSGPTAQRSGGRGLLLQKSTIGSPGSPSKEAENTPQKSNLKGKLFTPKRTSFAPRVDTPGEYTAADKKEDIAQAKQRGNYLKEMLMQETEDTTSKGSESDIPASKTSALFTTATSTAVSTSTALPTFSAGSLTSSATSGATLGLTATGVTSSAGTPTLSIPSLSASKIKDNPLLSESDKQKLKASSSEKNVQFEKPTVPQLSMSSSASATLGGTSEKAGAPSTGFTIPGAPSSLLKVQDSQKPLAFGTNPVGSGLGGATRVTQVDAKAQAISANNNAITVSSTGAAILGNATKSDRTTAPISGGFSVAGPASIFGVSSTTTTPASSVATALSSTKSQFPPIFGGLSSAPAGQSSTGTVPVKPSSTTAAGGFQFGQPLGSSSSTITGGLTFGTTKPASTVPSGLATPFPAASQTAVSTPASTTNKPMFSASAPNVTAPSGPQSGGPQFAPIFGQQTPTKPAGVPGGLSQGTPSFGAQTSQATTPGGFTFGQSTPSTKPATTPQAFSFGGNTAAPTSSNTSSSSVFGSGQPATPFSASKPATTTTTSMFGSTPTPSQTPLAGATSNTSTMFGGAPATPQKQLSFGGAASNTGVFGSGTTPGAPQKPSFGNPTATVTPFGSGTSQPTAAASPFQFGGSQPKPPTQTAPPSGGFNFGGQATPQKSFNFGGSAPAPTPSNGFPFGQSQSTSGPATQQNFFGGATANTASPFGGGCGFGNPAQSGGNPPAPSFGAAPSQAAAPGGGFSIGTGGQNTASSQKRANRLRQVRSRAGRR